VRSWDSRHASHRPPHNRQQPYRPPPRRAGDRGRPTRASLTTSLTCRSFTFSYVSWDSEKTSVVRLRISLTHRVADSQRWLAAKAVSELASSGQLHADQARCSRFRRCGCVRRRDRERGGSNLNQQVCATMINAGPPQRNPQPRESPDDFVPGFGGSGHNHLIGPSCHAMLAVLARNHGEVSDEVR